MVELVISITISLPKSQNFEFNLIFLLKIADITTANQYNPQSLNSSFNSDQYD